MNVLFYYLFLLFKFYYNYYIYIFAYNLLKHVVQIKFQQIIGHL